MAEPMNPQLFPELEKYVERTGLLSNATGILAARLPRILGQGKTRAKGLDLSPAKIERQQELLTLSLPKEASTDPGVQREIDETRRVVDAHADLMRHPEHKRRFALRVLRELKGVNTGDKDNHFFAGGFVLVPDENGLNWSWSMTPYYPMISNIPTDVNYVVKAFAASKRIVEKWTIPVDQFVDRLALAWNIARHFGDDENVLITDVARAFKVSVQDKRFWRHPARRNFGDVPDAVFIINLINWRRDRQAAASSKFDLVPATLNQAHGPKSRAFFVPGNPEGTIVRPMIHIRRLKNEGKRK